MSRPGSGRGRGCRAGRPGDAVAAGLAGPLALGLGLTARAVPPGVAPTTTASSIDASPAATTRRPIPTGWRTKRDKRLTISSRPLSRSGVDRHARPRARSSPRRSVGADGAQSSRPLVSRPRVGFGHRRRQPGPASEKREEDPDDAEPRPEDGPKGNPAETEPDQDRRPAGPWDRDRPDSRRARTAVLPLHDDARRRRRKRSRSRSGARSRPSRR